MNVGTNLIKQYKHKKVMRGHGEDCRQSQKKKQAISSYRQTFLIKSSKTGTQNRFELKRF